MRFEIPDEVLEVLERWKPDIVSAIADKANPLYKAKDAAAYLGIGLTAFYAIRHKIDHSDLLDNGQDFRYSQAALDKYAQEMEVRV